MRHKFFVIAKLDGYTGGPEALYQLGRALKDAGADVVMLASGQINPSIAADFETRYVMKATGQASADGDAWLVIPEVEDPAVWRAAGWSHIIVWWLAAPRRFGLGNYRGCHHVFQSFYAREQRAMDGFRGPVVSDYIRDDFAQMAAVLRVPRGEGVAVNHRSALTLGLVATQGGRRSISFLGGLAPHEIMGCMKRVKYYVDCGWHPGRDRMTREAALAGCIVMVGRQGAAGMHGDVPLPEIVRVEDDRPASIWERIDYCERHPAEIAEAMKDYMNWISAQKSVFQGEVDQLLKMIEAGELAPSVDLPVAVSDEEYLKLVRELDRARGLISSGGAVLMAALGRRPIRMTCLRLKHAIRRLMVSLMQRRNGSEKTERS